jgi:hypothetical protein
VSRAPLPHYPPRVSARLRAFYQALAEIESKKQGRTITMQEMRREIGVRPAKRRPEPKPKRQRYEALVKK